MQEKDMVNWNELIERGRKLQSQAVFEAFHRIMILMKICPGKRTTSTSTKNEAFVIDSTSIGLDVTMHPK